MKLEEKIKLFGNQLCKYCNEFVKLNSKNSYATITGIVYHRSCQRDYYKSLKKKGKIK